MEVTFHFTNSSASQPSPKTQTTEVYLEWPNIVSGMYILSPDLPAGYSYARACSINQNNVAEEGFARYLNPSETITWDIGYTKTGPWVQVYGGDVYAANTMSSYVPSTTTPRAFILDGTGGYPGIATYGQSYNLDSSGLTRGQTWVSSKNWLVNDTASGIDFYQLMYRQFGGAPAAVDYTDPSPISQPAARATPYYVTGNMTTSGDWMVGDVTKPGEKLIFIVNGNLTIGGKINTIADGFVAFIVNGNITVDPSVGVAYTSGVPVVEGIYITAPSKSFITNTGSAPSTARFVGRGMFVAGNFTLGRDVGEAGNPTTSSELFIYNPQLLLTMPEAMKKLSVSWQEVAP